MKIRESFKFFVIGLNTESFRFERVSEITTEIKDKRDLLAGFIAGESLRGKYNEFSSSVMWDGRSEIDAINEANKPLIAFENKAKSICNALNIWNEYAPIYKKFFDDNYNSLQWKSDGSLFKKWADIIKTLPRPDCSNYTSFYLDVECTSLTIRTGNNVEITQLIYNKHGNKPVENLDVYAFTYCDGMTLYLRDKEIRELEKQVSDLKSKISFLKSSMGK